MGSLFQGFVAFPAQIPDILLIQVSGQPPSRLVKFLFSELSTGSETGREETVPFIGLEFSAS